MNPLLPILTEIRDLLKEHKPAKEIMSIDEAAEYLGLSISYIDEMKALYQIPFFRTPGNGTRGRVKFRKSDLDKWAAERTIRNAEDERRLLDCRRSFNAA